MSGGSSSRTPKHIRAGAGAGSGAGSGAGAGAGAGADVHTDSGSAVLEPLAARLLQPGDVIFFKKKLEELSKLGQVVALPQRMVRASLKDTELDPSITHVATVIQVRPQILIAEAQEFEGMHITRLRDKFKTSEDFKELDNLQVYRFTAPGAGEKITTKAVALVAPGKGYNYISTVSALTPSRSSDDIKKTQQAFCSQLVHEILSKSNIAFDNSTHPSNKITPMSMQALIQRQSIPVYSFSLNALEMAATPGFSISPEDERKRTSTPFELRLVAFLASCLKSLEENPAFGAQKICSFIRSSQEMHLSASNTCIGLKKIFEATLSKTSPGRTEETQRTYETLYAIFKRAVIEPSQRKAATSSTAFRPESSIPMVDASKFSSSRFRPISPER